VPSLSWLPNGWLARPVTCHNGGCLATGLLLRCRIPQAHLFPFRHTGGNMEPPLGGDRLHLNRLSWASNHAHATTEALRPFHLRLAFLILGNGFYRAMLDAHAAGKTVVWSNDRKAARSLRRFLQPDRCAVSCSPRCVVPRRRPKQTFPGEDLFRKRLFLPLYQTMLRMTRAAQRSVFSITWALNRSAPPWLRGA
jgi:hypothetical protein